MNKSLPSFEKKHVSVDSGVNIQYKESPDSIYDSTESADIQQQIKELEQAQRKLQNNPSVIEQESKLNNARRQQKDLQNAKVSERQVLGPRPGASVYYETEEVCVGYKTVKTSKWYNPFTWGDTEQVPIYKTQRIRQSDDSAGREWDQKKSSIDEKYNSKLKENQRELEMYEELLETARENEQLRKQVEKKLARRRAELEELRREAEFAKQNAKTAYLKSVKQQIGRELDDWLNDGGSVYLNLKSCFLENLRNCQKSMEQSINVEYDRKLKDYKENIRIVLQREMQKGENKENQDNVNAYKEDLKRIADVKQLIVDEFKNIK